MTFVLPSAQRPKDEREKIPVVLLRAMLALAVTTVAIVGAAVITDRTPSGQPKVTPISSERSVILQGHDAKAVTVRTADGAILADLPHGGFITVVQNGLTRARMIRGVSGNPPVSLQRYENGRLTLFDPETGWSVELGVFGSDNKAAFERLLTE